MYVDKKHTRIQMEAVRLPDSSDSLGDAGENSTILRIEKLEERVRQLELQSYGGKQLDATRYQSNENEIICRRSKSTIIVGESSIANSCSTLKNLICTSKLARFQCIWLLISLMGFTFYAVDGYLEAYKNENSQYKPQRKTGTKNYGVLEDVQYGMPYFFMEFYVTELISDYEDCPANYIDLVDANCVTDKSWSAEEMMETFSGMWGVNVTWECDFDCVGSVDPLEMSDEISCEYTTMTPGVSFDISELKFGVWRPQSDVDNLFMGWIAFKPKDPNPGSLWTCSLKFNAEQITNGAPLFVSQYILRMNNDDNPDFLTEFTQGVEFEIENLLSGDGRNNVFKVAYEESVSKLYQTNIPFFSGPEVFRYTYDVGIEREEEQEDSDSVLISISPDMPVEELEEYVEYSYLNWVASLGGFLSVLSLQYFWIAALLINWFGESEWDMGILPLMSHVFINREIVFWMKAQLTGTQVLESP